MIKHTKSKKLNNKGSAIVMVIVVVAFVSILATTILYSAGMNYYMKMNDINIKENFYDSELALDAIKKEFIMIADEAHKEAYMDTIIRYASSDSATREYSYQTLYFNLLCEKWNAKKENPSNPTSPFTNQEVLQNVSNTAYGGITPPNSPTIVCDDSVTVNINSAGYATFGDVRLTYTDSKGVTSIIETELIFLLPDVDWKVDGSSTTWNATHDASDLQRETIDMSDYVQYYNWTKK